MPLRFSIMPTGHRSRLLANRCRPKDSRSGDASPRSCASPYGFPGYRSVVHAAPSSDRDGSGRRPGAERLGDTSAPAAPRHAVASVSSALSKRVFQGHTVRHRIRQKALELRIFVFDLREPLGVRQLHPALLGLQLLECRAAQPELSAQIGRRQTCLPLFDPPDYLRLGEMVLPHVVCSISGGADPRSQRGNVQDAGLQFS